MKKLLAVLFAGVLGLNGLAETDYLALPILSDIQKGVDNRNQIKDLRVQGTATIGGASTLTGNTTVGGDLGVAGGASITGNALISGAATVTGNVVTDGKVAAVGASGTVGIMVQAGTSTVSDEETTITTTFATAFGGVPVVVCQYNSVTNSIVTNLYLTAVSPSNFVCEAALGSKFEYIAVGTRP